MRPADQEMVGIGKVVHYSPRRRGRFKPWGQSGGQERKHEQGLLWFLPRSKARQAGSGLARLNNFSGLWGRGAAPGCLTPGPGVTGAGG